MGQCFSSGKRQGDGEVPAHGRPEPTEPVTLGVADRVLYPVVPSGTGQLHLAVSQARYAAAAGGNVTPVLVRQSAHHIFIALFEGLGEDQHSVAAFCRIRVFELFRESSARHPSSPLDALRGTVQSLDEAVFATSSLTEETKARSGASCLLLLVELHSLRCYCASAGAARCLLSRISGSFNAKQPEGFFLSDHHRGSTGRSSKGPSTSSSSSSSAEAEEQGSGELEPWRALGFTAHKQAADGSGSLAPCQPAVTDHTLAAADQCLVLGSSAFWRLVGPTGCALRAHFHEKFAQRETEVAQAAAAAAAAAGVEAPPSPSLMHAINTAEHLVYWSLEKASHRLAAMQGQRQQRAGSSAASAGVLPPSVADLMALPQHRRGPAAPATAAAAVGPTGAASIAAPASMGLNRAEGGQAQAAGAAEPEQQQQRELVRADVHGDIGVVVVMLRCPNQSMDSRMRGMLLSARANVGAGHGSGGVGGAGQQSYRRLLAQRRWDQVRLLVNFHKAYRRVLLRQWWEAQDTLYRRDRTARPQAGRIALRSPNKLATAAAGTATARRAAAASAAGAGAGADKKQAAASLGGSKAPLSARGSASSAVGAGTIKAVRAGSNPGAK